MIRDHINSTTQYRIYAYFELFERLLFQLLPSPQLRLWFLRKRHKFAYLGERIHWQPRKYPIDGDRIRIHNNVAIATGVEFFMHDIISYVLTGIGPENFAGYKGCCEIYDNVFIGAGSKILYGVRIGPNAIVAAGSVVTKDVPPGTVVGGGKCESYWKV